MGTELHLHVVGPSRSGKTRVANALIGGDAVLPLRTQLGATAVRVEVSCRVDDPDRPPDPSGRTVTADDVLCTESDAVYECFKECFADARTPVVRVVDSAAAGALRITDGAGDCAVGDTGHALGRTHVVLLTAAAGAPHNLARAVPPDGTCPAGIICVVGSVDACDPDPVYDMGSGPDAVQLHMKDYLARIPSVPHIKVALDADFARTVLVVTRALTQTWEEGQRTQVSAYEHAVKKYTLPRVLLGTSYPVTSHMTNVVVHTLCKAVIRCARDNIKILTKGGGHTHRAYASAVRDGLHAAMKKLTPLVARLAAKEFLSTHTGLAVENSLLDRPTRALDISVPPPGPYVTEWDVESAGVRAEHVSGEAAEGVFERLSHAAYVCALLPWIDAVRNVVRVNERVQRELVNARAMALSVVTL